MKTYAKSMFMLAFVASMGINCGGDGGGVTPPPPPKQDTTWYVVVAGQTVRDGTMLNLDAEITAQICGTVFGRTSGGATVKPQNGMTITVGGQTVAVNNETACFAPRSTGPLPITIGTETVTPVVPADSVAGSLVKAVIFQGEVSSLASFIQCSQITSRPNRTIAVFVDGQPISAVKSLGIGAHTPSCNLLDSSSRVTATWQKVNGLIVSDNPAMSIVVDYVGGMSNADNAAAKVTVFTGSGTSWTAVDSAAVSGRSFSVKSAAFITATQVKIRVDATAAGYNPTERVVKYGNYGSQTFTVSPKIWPKYGQIDIPKTYHESANSPDHVLSWNFGGKLYGVPRDRVLLIAFDMDSAVVKPAQAEVDAAFARILYYDSVITGKVLLKRATVAEARASRGFIFTVSDRNESYRLEVDSAGYIIGGAFSVGVDVGTRKASWVLLMHEFDHTRFHAGHTCDWATVQAKGCPEFPGWNGDPMNPTDDDIHMLQAQMDVWDAGYKNGNSQAWLEMYQSMQSMGLVSFSKPTGSRIR